MKDVIILLGIQGSGKGTQGKIICDNFSFKSISTGSLLRKEVASGSDLGKEIANLIDNGNLVSDELVFKILQNEISNSNEKGFILDGFPRTLQQAEILDKNSKELGINIKKVILIDLDKEHVIARIKSRINCSKCGAIYNSISCKPKVDGICDVCGSELKVRVDDAEIESIKKRINIFEQNIGDIVSFYLKKSLIFTVNGLKDVNTISREIMQALNSDNEL